MVNTFENMKFFLIVACLLVAYVDSLSKGPKSTGSANRRINYDQALFLDNPYHGDGEWGDIDLCDENSFVFGIEVKYEKPGHLDETAINGIKLYCSFTNDSDTGYVSSSVGTNGDWFGMRICNSSIALLVGFRANVLSYQGAFTDDVAVENIEVKCGDGEIVAGLPMDVPKMADLYDFQAGTWSSWASCNKGSSVCGIQTRYEDGSIGDEVAIAEVVFLCCKN